MAKSMLKIQQVVALALVLLLTVPVATLASDGKKHFKQGMQFEENRQWDKAAEQFALALAEKPSNIEYQLHLQKSLVNAGAMLVERGDKLAEQKDFNAAYQAYRQAYSFDSTNEMALIKARRMLEKQGLPTSDLPSGSDPSGPKLKPEEDANKKASFMTTSLDSSGKPITVPIANGMNFKSRNIPVQLPAIPGRRFAKTDVVYRDTPLLSAIEQLAQTMKLNVIFDQQVINMMKQQKVNIELRDVSYPHALEMLLKTNNLMYAQMDTRTIVVASDNPQSRMKYEPYSVRTFYIKNADIADVRAAIQGSLSTKSVTPVKQLNALIVRDTPANLELIESMINSMDKAKAEVLIDINLYEVSRNDLLQLGNQFNSADSQAKNPFGLSFLGGIGQQGTILGAGPRTLTGPFGLALGLPTSTLSFFQDKGKAKLLASTQVHVLDDQDQSIKIGQRVPVQTAFIPTYNTVVNTGNGRNGQINPADPTGGFNNFGFGGGGYPQIQYENVGLNIDMKPNVYEDEVQLKMKIESSSIDRSTGNFTPSFNQRQMSSMARIRDGQTTMVAGVSKTEESKRVKGIPIIGLIPILGRFFATPDTTDSQSDVVITVTPHILRRADIRDEDHYAKYSGDAQNAFNQLRIEQILYLADQEDAQAPAVASAGAQPEVKPAAPPATIQTQAPSGTGVVVGPIPTQPPPGRADIQRMPVSAPGVPANNAAKSSQQNKLDDDDDDDDDDDSNQQSAQSAQPVIVSVRAAPGAVRGQDLFVAINLVGNNEISSAHISLSYDPNLLEPKNVRDSGLLRTGGTPPDLQFTGEGGLLNIQLDKPQGSGGSMARGQLCLVIFTVKNAGTSPLTLNEGQCFLRMPNGQMLPLKIQSSQVETR
jgi:general secretion pathway protein D